MLCHTYEENPLFFEGMVRVWLKGLASIEDSILTCLPFVSTSPRQSAQQRTHASAQQSLRLYPQGQLLRRHRVGGIHVH